MIKSKTLLPLCLLILSCTANKTSELANSDTTNDTTKATATSSTATEENKAVAVFDSTLHDIDTLFNMLAKMGAVHGDFVSATAVTETLLDASDPGSSRQLSAYLIESGEGQYGGVHQNVLYETVYGVLAVFENVDGDLRYVTHLEVASASSGGLIVSTTEGEELKLADDKNGVLIHNKSSEEGAGDSGFRRDEVVLYVLINDKLENIFEETVDDFSFASNETDSYGEQTTTVELTVLESKTNGLFDLQTVRTTSGTSWTEEEEDERSEGSEETGETPAEDSEETSEEQTTEEPADGGEVDDGIDVYKWTGSRYEVSDE